MVSCQSILSLFDEEVNNETEEKMVKNLSQVIIKWQIPPKQKLGGSLYGKSDNGVPLFKYLIWFYG